MNRVILICALVLSCVFLSSISVCAQDDEKYAFVYGGLSLPQGDFGDDGRGNYDGYANTGFCIGLEVVMPMSTPSLGWATNISFILNGVDDYVLNGDDYYDYDSDGDIGSYLILPIMSGLRYATEISDELQLFGKLQAGLNLFKAPTMEYAGYTSTFKLASSFGFSFGGGLIINEKTHISLQLYNLGKITAKWEADNGEGSRSRFSVSTMTLTVGVPL